LLALAHASAFLARALQVGTAGPITTGFAVTDVTATSSTVTNTGFRSIMRANTVVAGNANWAYSSLKEWTNVYTCTGASAGAYCYSVLAASYLTARVTAVFSTACASSATVGTKPTAAVGTPNAAITSIAVAKSTGSSTTCPPTYTYAGQTATLKGMVTALVAGGFYMQDSNAVNSGIFVANTAQNLVDQVVTVTAGVLVQYGGQLQLQGGSVTVAGTLSTPAPVPLSSPPPGLLTACTSTSSPGGVQYEGMTVSFTGGVTLLAAASSNANQLGYLVTSSGVLVLGTQSYMQNYQAGGTFATMSGVIIGAPAMQNAYGALYVRGPADLGTYTKTIYTSNTCVTAGQCTGATVGATLPSVLATGSPVTFTPLSIFSAGMRPFGPATTSPGTTFAPTGYTPMSAVGAVSVAPLLLNAGSNPGTGYAANPSSVFATCSNANASSWATTASVYAPYINTKVYIEGIFTAVAPVAQYLPVADMSYVSNSVATCDTTCTAALPLGTPALAYFATSASSGCSDPTTTPGGSSAGWCVSCIYPSGYYMSTTEVSGPFSGIAVNLNPDQIQYLLAPNNPYPMAPLCPSLTGASLLPQFPSATTTLRLGVTGTLSLDSDTGSGLVLSAITSTTVLSTSTAMVQAQLLSTQAFSYTWTGTQNNALGAALITSPSAPTVCAAGSPATPPISNPAFVPYKGAVVSFPNVTVMSFTSSLLLDAQTSAKSGFYVVTDTNGAQAYPIIVASTLYGSWKPQALSASDIPPSLFQCAMIAPLTGILDWNANLLAWTLQPRFSNDISAGALGLSLNTRCAPACGGPTKLLTFPAGATAALPGPTSAPASCAYPPPPPPSPPPPVASPPPTAPIMPPPSPSPRPPLPPPASPRPPPPVFPPPAAKPPPPPLAPTPVTYVSQNVTADVLVTNFAPSSDPLGIGGLAGNLPIRVLISYVEAVNAEAIANYPAGILSTSNVQTFWPSAGTPAVAGAGDTTGYPSPTVTAITVCSSADSKAGTNGCIGQTYLGSIIQTGSSRHLLATSGRRMLQSGVPKVPQAAHAGRELLQTSAAALALQRASYATYGGTAPMNTQLASTATPATASGPPPGATGLIVTGYTVYAVLQFGNTTFATVNTAAARTSVLGAAFNDFSNYVSKVNTQLDSTYLLSAVTQSMFEPYGAWQDTTTTSAANFLMVVGTTASPLPNYYAASAILSWLANSNDPNNGTFPVLAGPSSLATVSGTGGRPTLQNMPTGAPSPQLGAKVILQQTVTSVAQATAIANAASAVVADGTMCKAMLYNSMQCYASPVVLPVSTIPVQTPPNAAVVAAQAAATAALADAKKDLGNTKSLRKMALIAACVLGPILACVLLASLVRARAFPSRRYEPSTNARA
jgi:hypothetical protein